MNIIYNIISDLFDFLAIISAEDKVSISNFKMLKVLGTGAYGRVYLVQKKDGVDKGKLYAMKVLKKVTITLKKKTTEHTKTERQVRDADV